MGLLLVLKLFRRYPPSDALRHERKGAAAMLEEASGVRAGTTDLVSKVQLVL